MTGYFTRFVELSDAWNYSPDAPQLGASDPPTDPIGASNHEDVDFSPPSRRSSCSSPARWSSWPTCAAPTRAPWPASRPSQVLVVDELIPAGTPATSSPSWCAPSWCPAKTALDGRVIDLADLAGQVTAIDLLPGEQLLSAASSSRTRCRPRARSRCRPGSRRSASSSSRSARSAAASRPATPSASSSRWSSRTARPTPTRCCTACWSPRCRAPRRRARPEGGTATASAAATLPSSSLMVTLAPHARHAEPVVFGIEHGTLWLSLETDGADTRGTESSTRARSIGERPMSRVVLAGADEDLILRVKEATDGDVTVLPPGRLPSDPARLFEQLLDGELPDVLLVGPHAPAPEVLTLASRLDIQSPGISVVLMAEPSPEMWQAAMRAGIRDLVPPAAERGRDPRRRGAGRPRRRQPAAGAAPGQRDRALRRPGHHHRLAEGRGGQDDGRHQPGHRADRRCAAVDRARRPRRPVR